ncbi:MAG: hypothetical protein AAF611_14565 [Bacteroidota bacterium]
MHFIFLLVILVSTQITAQTVDATKLSTQSEVNFIQTEKRGIQTKKGDIFWVHSDLKTVLCVDADKNIRWKVNIIEKCGKPMVGAAEIRHIQLTKKGLGITYGKHNYAVLDAKTGNVIYFGSD